MHAVTLMPSPADRRPPLPVEGRAYRPNEFERRRIERALEDRKRYRYVSPAVLVDGDAYRIESPCCSRNVDPAGGVIDVALLRFDPADGRWDLHRKDHGAGAWLPHSTHVNLSALLARLVDDPDREFWQ